MVTHRDVKYLSEDEINTLISKSVKLVGLDPTQAKILKQILQEETLPVCNQCGHSYHPERYGTIEFNTSWGYESTGKDGDHDSWNLCRTCADEFKKDNPPVCCKCLRSVVYIMGDLAARNTGCTFYGDPEAAQKHMEDINGCGYEFANINGMIFCEVCYEDFISQFKKPVLAQSYLFGCGDIVGPAEDAPQFHQNRIEAHFQYKAPGRHEAVLPYDEAVAARKSPTNHQRLIRVTYRLLDGFDFDLEQGKKQEDEPLICQRADGEFFDIPPSQLVGADFTKMAIQNFGRVLVLGDLKLDAAQLCDQYSNSSKE